jgi:hypothetical protein
VEDKSGAAMLFIGGLLPYLLYSSERKNMWSCDRCHYVFSEKTPRQAEKFFALTLAAFCVLTLIVILWMVFVR